jgi:hypothetical protein
MPSKFSFLRLHTSGSQGFNALQAENIFGVSAATDPSNYYLPGAGNPAKSTSDYYHIDGLLWAKPYDLTKWGTPGNTIAAAKGRYWWTWSEDHPAVIDWRDTAGYWFGFSDDPGILPDPSRTYIGIPPNASWADGAALGTGVSNGGVSDMGSWVVYNPDDATYPFYLYSQGHFFSTNFAGAFNCGVLHRSSDLYNWVPYGVSHPTELTAGNGFAAFQTVERLGTGNWQCFGRGMKTLFTDETFKWVSTDGKLFDFADGKLINGSSPNTTTVAHISTTAGSGVITSDVDLWVPGDVGSAMTLFGVNSNTGTTGAGGTGYIQSRILTYTNARQITLDIGKDLKGNTYAPFTITDTLTSQLLLGEWHSIANRVIGTSKWDVRPQPVDTITMGGQTYVVTSERTNYTSGGFGTANTDPFYLSLVAVDARYNVLSSPAPIRIAPDPTRYNNGFPSPQWFSDLSAIAEDGVYHIYVMHGYSDQINTISPGTPYRPDGQGGGLVQKWMDYYTYVFDSTAAATSAPCGVVASCAASTVTLSWYNAVPGLTYQINRYTSAANAASNTSPTSLGTTSSHSITDTPTVGSQYWYKVSNNNGGAGRIVHCYVSSASQFINAHINRVIDDGGDATTINLTHIANVDNWLDSNGLKSCLLYWADPRFGVKKSGSTVQKVYCIGTTHLPRGFDLTPTTTNVTYSATGLNGTLPAWSAPNSTDYMCWGINPKDPNVGGRFNHIRKINQITVAGLYQRTTTAAATTLLGSTTSTSSSHDFAGSPIYDGLNTGMYLSHGTGTPGTITFALRDEGGLKTATVTASGNTNTVAVGIYDGTSMIAYSDGTGGTANTTLDPNPFFANDTFLAGARMYTGSIIKFPLLCSGSKDAIFDACDGTASASGSPTYYPGIQNQFGNNAFGPPARSFSETEAKGNFGSLLVLDKGLNSTLVASLTSLLTGP